MPPLQHLCLPPLRPLARHFRELAQPCFLSVPLSESKDGLLVFHTCIASAPKVSENLGALIREIRQVYGYGVLPGTIIIASGVPQG